MSRRIFWEEALARRGDIGVTDVGEDSRGAAVFGMDHDAHAEFVGGAFETDSYHPDFWVWLAINF